MKYLSILAVAVLLVSCSLGDTKFETVTVSGHYQMDVPDYMTESNELNSDASLQYENTSKETYVVVINEDKELLIELFNEIDGWDNDATPLENYAALQSEGMEMSLDLSDQSGPNDKKINGMPAKTYEYTGYAPDIPYEIFYYIAYIEGGRELYMVSAWCLAEDKDSYKDTFVKMVDTFKEL